MDAKRAQDNVQRGLGRAARVVGEWCEVFRPDGPAAPLSPRCLALRMPAAFSAPDGRFARPVAHGQVYWHGVFDAAYTRPGDYIRRADGAVWFIATQQQLLPVLCVRASRVIDVLRPVGPELPGIAPYGGGGGPDMLLRGWPAGVVAAGGGGVGDADLPDGLAAGGWVLLLPPLPGVAPRAGDLVRDEMGRGGVIAQAELSEPGWRLLVRRAAS
ncbi:MAG: hypothetical protein IT555_02925 [Acetobacteraceae bacterium]|nr:hypothetical protein [Acetobacteraceae bacterium]